MAIEISTPAVARGMYLTAETGTDGADGSGTILWQLRDALGRPFGGAALVRIWYVEDANTQGTPHLATGSFTAASPGNLYETVNANQELQMLTSGNGLVGVVANDGKNGALWAMAIFNGFGALSNVTVSGT